MNGSSVPVWSGAIPVGALLPAEGGVVFRYDAAWRQRRGAFPASLRMPLVAPDDVPVSVVTPWLANLLPEGNPLRAMQAYSGLSGDDILGMVLEVGRDTAGALSFGAPRVGEAPRLLPVSDRQTLERIIEELPARPFLVGGEGVSMSLAGAQDKLPVVVDKVGQIGIPVDGYPSTHILKPDHLHRPPGHRLDGAVQNEAFCMVLARLCKLPVAPVTTGVAGHRSYLLVTRYDRTRRDGIWHRLHQEDFCQALGRFPIHKYEHNPGNRHGLRGPTLSQMFGVLKTHALADSVTRMMDAVIFNVLVTNVDSHAKNYSLMLGQDRAHLAALYDLMVGGVYDWVTKNLAQDVGGKNRAQHLLKRHWQREAAACGVSAAGMVRRVTALATLIPKRVDEAAAIVSAMPAGPHPILDDCQRMVAEMCHRTLVNMSQADDALEAEGELDSRPVLST